MLLMIDNYDSFTYNLVQHLGELGEDVRVFRNNKITLREIEELAPDRIEGRKKKPNRTTADHSHQDRRIFLRFMSCRRTGDRPRSSCSPMADRRSTHFDRWTCKDGTRQPP